MEAADVCSKPKRARSQNFSIIEMNIIHNEVKANPVLESKFSNTCTNQKKQNIWLGITEKVNAVGNTRRTVNEVRDKWRNTCRDAKQKFAEHRRESKRTGGGPPPTPLSQSVTDIVEMYKDCSSFVGIPGGMETSISIETGVIFNNLYITHKKIDEKLFYYIITQSLIQFNPFKQFISLYPIEII